MLPIATARIVLKPEIKVGLSSSQVQRLARSVSSGAAACRHRGKRPSISICSEKLKIARITMITAKIPSRSNEGSDHADDIGSYEKLKVQQDASAEIGAI